MGGTNGGNQLFNDPFRLLEELGVANEEEADEGSDYCIYCHTRLNEIVINIVLERRQFGLHPDCAEVLAAEIMTAARQARDLIS